VSELGISQLDGGLHIFVLSVLLFHSPLQH
jgi:hypothetical protein